MRSTLAAGQCWDGVLVGSSRGRISDGRDDRRENPDGTLDEDYQRGRRDQAVDDRQDGPARFNRDDVAAESTRERSEQEGREAEREQSERERPKLEIPRREREKDDESEREDAEKPQRGVVVIDL